MIDINELSKLRDDILFHFLKTDLVDKAKREFFKLMDDEEIEVDFTDWFIHDFKDNGETIIEMYKNLKIASDDYIDILNNSKLIFAKLKKAGSNIFFKDIITNKDFSVVENDNEYVFNTSSVYLIRVYNINDRFIPAEDYKEFDENLESMIVKGMLEKYNERAKLGSISIEDFIYENPLLLVALGNIIDTIEIKNTVEDMLCYESIYKILDKSLYKEEIKKLNLIETEFKDVFKLEYKDRIIAEIVNELNTIEVEANTETDRLIVKDLLKDFESLVFVSDKVTSFDELL